MPTVKEYTTYKFGELTEEAQEKAIEKYREMDSQDTFWSECAIDDCKEIAKIIGINIKNIYWSGFWSQGDGAMFEGEYTYKKGALKAIKEYAPQDKELHNIALALQKAQSKWFYSICANVKHTGHYYHENCTSWDISGNNWQSWQDPKGFDEDDIKEPLKDFMRWIYRRLESEYEYVTSDEAIKETLIANEYDFTEDGEID